MKKFKFVILALWVGILFDPSQSAQAYFATPQESCTPVDLRQTFPIKIRNQGDIAWCYANAAADYLQYVYKLPQQISASDIAIQYNLRNWPNFKRFLSGGIVGETGFIRGAIWDALDTGYCLERDFPSYVWSKITVTGKDAGRIEKKEIFDSIPDLTQLQEWIQDGIFADETEIPYRFDFKQLTPAAFFKVLKESSKDLLLNSLRISACEKNRVQYPFQIDAIAMTFKGPHAFEKLNGQLNLGMPATVDYFSGVLQDNDSFPLVFSALHTSLLYGRRFNTHTNECQYLIKNSEGRRCLPGYDPRNDCEGGYLWLSETSFYRAMVSYEFVKDDIRSPASIPDLSLTDPMQNTSEEVDDD